MRVAAMCLGALTIAMVQRLLAMVFVLNFDVAGPNATAAMAALLITAPVLWLPKRRWSAPLMLAVVLLGTAASIMMPPTTAALGAAVVLLATMPLWRAVDAPQGAIMGALLWITLTAIMGGVSPWSIAPWTMLLLVAGLWPLRRAALDGAIPSGPWLFMFLQAAFLATPAVWRWLGLDAVLMSIMASAGLVLALWTPATVQARWSVALVPAMAALLWWPLAAPVGLLIAQWSAAATLRSGGSVRALIGWQAGAVVLVFMYVVAGNWAFVGFVPEVLSHGTAAFYILGLSALLPVAAWRST